MNYYRLGAEAAIGSLDKLPDRYDEARGFRRSEGPLARPGSYPVALDKIRLVPEAMDYARGGWHAVADMAKKAAASPSPAERWKVEPLRVAGDRFRWVYDLGRWGLAQPAFSAKELRALVEKMRGGLDAANRAARDAREGRASQVVEQRANGEVKEFQLPDVLDRLNRDHKRLADLWPGMRAAAAKLSREQMVAWNATVYIQQGMELQVAHALASAGGGQKELKYPLGVFAGLPGGGVAHDPKDARFAVPRLTVRDALGRELKFDDAVGLAPLVIGAYILIGIAIVVFLGYTVRAAVGAFFGGDERILGMRDQEAA